MSARSDPSMHRFQGVGGCSREGPGPLHFQGTGRLPPRDNFGLPPNSCRMMKHPALCSFQPRVSPLSRKLPTACKATSPSSSCPRGPPPCAPSTPAPDEESKAHCGQKRRAPACETYQGKSKEILATLYFPCFSTVSPAPRPRSCHPIVLNARNRERKAREKAMGFDPRAACSRWPVLT